MCRSVRSTRDARNQFEGAHAVAAAIAQRAEQRHGGVGVAHRDEGRGARLERRVQLEAGGGDDAQRAFGAEEQRLHVVTGVVLAQSGERIEHPAIREHHLEAEHQFARHAVADDVQAAGVGGEIAAQHAAAFAAQAQRQVAIGLRGGGLQLRQDAAGLGGHGVVSGVDGAHAVEPRQRQQHLAAGGIGRGAAAVAGVAALRHHADAVFVAEGDDAGHGGGVRRRHHGQRMAAIQRPVVAQHRGDARRVREHGRFVEQLAELTRNGGVIVHAR